MDGTWKLTEESVNGSTTNYPVEITGTVTDDNWRGGGHIQRLSL